MINALRLADIDSDITNAVFDLQCVESDISWTDVRMTCAANAQDVLNSAAEIPSLQWLFLPPSVPVLVGARPTDPELRVLDFPLRHEADAANSLRILGYLVGRVLTQHPETTVFFPHFLASQAASIVAAFPADVDKDAIVSRMVFIQP